MNTDKICGNCKHYLRHYFKEGTHFHPICLGHCINLLRREKPSEKNKYLRNHKKGCELWELKEDNSKEQKISVAFMLKDISDRINELNEVLKDEPEITL